MLDHHIRPIATTRVRLTPHHHLNSYGIRYIGHLTYMFLYMYSCIQCWTLTFRICDMMTHANKVRQRYNMFKKVNWWWFYEGFMFLYFTKREKKKYRKKKAKLHFLPPKFQKLRFWPPIKKMAKLTPHD
jgi:hypothetical protein